MDELAYRRHIERSKKADELYESLRELYGKDMDNRLLFLHARRDKVINEQEHSLLREFKGR